MSEPLPRRLRVLVSSVSSDAHTWNLVYVQLVLEELGHDVLNLGACVPDEVLVASVRRERPDLVAIGTVNGHGNIDGERLIRRLRAERDLCGVHVVIGGKLGIRGAADAHGARLLGAGYDAVFESQAGADAFAAYVGRLAAARTELAS